MMAAPTQLVAHAQAKLNLSLEVLGQRPDGLHEVATVMQTIDLADRLDFALDESRVAVRCRGMRVDPSNLILQAAHLIKDRGSVAEGCSIRCVKHIPISAGLGGGSADAAATLCALWRLWEVRLDLATLVDLAGRLGADVPFCLEGGSALATGDGREIQALTPAPPHWVVLVPIASPDPLKTAQMYRASQRGDWSDGTRTKRLAASLAEGQLDYGAVGSAFEGLARDHWPEVGRALDILEEHNALAATVSGSGPSTFGLFPTRDAALAVLHRLRRGDLPAALHRFTGPEDPRTRGTPPVRRRGRLHEVPPA